MTRAKKPTPKSSVTASGKRSVAIGGNAQGNVIFTGDILLQLTAPVRRLSFDYAVRIENFIRLYLGSPESPEPFGGRDDALRALDAWLEKPSQPYALLTAPAGLGKSALLVRWMASLRQRRPDLPIAFLPVSARFSTNLASVTFASLTAQLAHVISEDAPTDPNLPDQVWRGMFSDLLRRVPPDKRLLVILDGVDEAANWDVDGGLFPLDPPPGLKVIISARLTADRPAPDDWRRALAWERLNVRRFDLAPLDRPGLRDVLEKMGVPLDELARQPFIVDELYRLTSGDPLLTRFYALDLWQKGEAARRLRPADLHSLRPDYEGYFDRWWEDQRRLWGEKQPLRERAVREILNLLSAALGPLRPDDLLTLADPAAGLDTWTLEESLKLLARFVIQSDGAYVFAHPRLPQYFWGKLTGPERARLEGRFLDWGRRTLADLRAERLAPKETPPYLVRYYRAHLERACAPLDDWRALVQIPAWAQAWEALEGGFGGYLGDVEAVWKTAEAENHRAAESNAPLPALGLEIRCALIEASIHSLAANLPPELPALLVQHGHWTPRQALTYLRQMPDEGQRAEALEALAPRLPPDLLPEALAAAREIQNEFDRARALTALAERLPEVLPAALAAAREIQNEFDRARALTALAERLPEVLPAALAAAREIRDEGPRAFALAALAPHLPPDLLPAALAAAREIQSEYARARALTALATHLPPDLLPEALAAAREIQSEYARALALTALAPHLPEVLSEALAATRAIQDNTRAYILTTLAEHLPNLLPEALSTAREIRDMQICANIMMLLAKYLPKELQPEGWDTALEIQVARQIAFGEDAFVRIFGQSDLMNVTTQAKTEFAEFYAQISSTPIPMTRLPQVLSAARNIQVAGIRALALAALSERLPELWLEALNASRKIEILGDQARVLSILAERLPIEVLPDFLSIVQEISFVRLRFEILEALLKRSPNVLPEVLAAARQIREVSFRAEVITVLSQYFPELLSEALITIRKIQHDDDARAYALTTLAERLSLDLLPEALAAAREIQDANDRACALTALAERLTALPIPQAYPLWAETLPVLARCTRKDLLSDVRALAPFILHLGGEQAVGETYRTIQEVTRWWP